MGDIKIYGPVATYLVVFLFVASSVVVLVLPVVLSMVYRRLRRIDETLREMAGRGLNSESVVVGSLLGR